LGIIIYQQAKAGTMRTIIDIPIDRLQHLDQWASSCKISRAEAVRRAVGDFLDRMATPTWRILKQIASSPHGVCAGSYQYK